MTEITVITRNHFEEPPRFVEMFQRLQARYRSLAVHTPKEWPMNTEAGRQAYRESVSRDRFLERLNNEMPAVIARAEERLRSVPVGCVVNFDSLIYGEVEQ